MGKKRTGGSKGKKRAGSSFADTTKALENLKAGLEGGKADKNQADFLKEVESALTKRKDLDAKQETAKAELKTSTKNLKEHDKTNKDLFGRVVSYLESKYGKFSPELHKYGVSPRKKPEKKKTNDGDNSGNSAES